MKKNYNLTQIVKFDLCMYVTISVNIPSRFKALNIFRANRARIFSPGFKPKPRLTEPAGYDVFKAVVSKMEYGAYWEIPGSLKHYSFSFSIKHYISYYLSHVIAYAI